MYIYIYKYTSIYIHIYIYTDTYKYIYIYIYVYLFKKIDTCIYRERCIHIYMYQYIHTRHNVPVPLCHAPRCEGSPLLQRPIEVRMHIAIWKWLLRT